MILTILILLSLFGSAKTHTTLFLQPYGNYTQAEAEKMKSELDLHMSELLNEKIDIVVLPGKKLQPEFKNKAKTRYRASKIMDACKPQVDRHSVVMALTHEDISTTARGHEDWGVMGLSYKGRNLCAVSSFRVKDRSQLWKVAIHEFIHAHYDHPHCNSGDNACIMQDAKGGNPLKREKRLCKECNTKINN